MGDTGELINQLARIKEGEKSSAEIQAILTSIKSILNAEETDKKIAVDNMVRDGIVKVFSDLLKSTSNTAADAHTIYALIAEILADIAKLDLGRKRCSESEVIIPLLKLLDSENFDVVLQVCRALGNICYDNDIARSLVKENDGVQCLINLLRNLLEKDHLPDNMRTVTSGCLLNLTDTYEEIQDQAVEAGILEVLLEYLLKFSTDEDVVTHCLLVLSCLADSSSGRTKILEKSALQNLLNLLEKPLNDDIMDSLLELFGNLCENDAAKLELAKMGLCEKLVEIVERHMSSGNVSNGTFNICKTVPDLVILILTGDTSMEYLWKKGTGVVYKKTLEWLKSTDENLLIAGALAAGNFARKDEHCIQMLKDGVVEQLGELLAKHSGRDGDIRMQHAVLSALRNLAIPVQNKAKMVELGVDDKLIDMMNVETFPVVFKLLGTLRMLLDKQESVAIKVGENLGVVERLVKWCNVDDHPGVKGEATRSLAWLAKNSNLARRCTSVLKNLVKVNALPPIISMLKSEHDVMKNEALIAVKLVASYSLNEIEKIATSTNLVNQLNDLLNSDMYDLSPDLRDNVVSLLLVLADSDNLKAQISIPDTLKEQKDEKIKELLNKTNTS